MSRKQKTMSVHAQKLALVFVGRSRIFRFALNVIIFSASSEALLVRNGSSLMDFYLGKTTLIETKRSNIFHLAAIISKQRLFRQSTLTERV